mgnify:CR=1 FL=1
MVLFTPNIAHASLDSFISNVNTQIINPIIQLLFAVAILYFLYGVFRLFSNADNEEVKTEAKNTMLWGIIGLAIMLGVWGILNLILSTFNINDVKIKDDGNQGEIEIKLNPYNPPTPTVGVPRN